MTTDETLDAIGRVLSEHWYNPGDDGLYDWCECGVRFDLSLSSGGMEQWKRHLVEKIIQCGVLLTPEQAEARVKAAKEMAEANIRDIEEQSNLEKQAAVAAALERVSQLRPQAKYLNAIENPKFKEGYETGWNDYRADIRSLAPTDALRKVTLRAQLEQGWRVLDWHRVAHSTFEKDMLNHIAELQQAMDKVRGEVK